MKVSVIIPAWNSANTLGETLDSLRDQTFDDWEAIIVDDGSSDATLAIAQSYRASDPRFTVLRRNHLGVSAARNAALKRASHDHVLFLDADDWLEKRHMELMTGIMERDPSLDAAYCGWTYRGPDGHDVFGLSPQTTGDLFPVHSRACPYAIHSFLCRTEIIVGVGGFDTSLAVCEDWDLWQRVSRLGARFGAVPEMLAPCRMRPGSASMDSLRFLRAGLRVLARGYSGDDRVARDRTVYPEGMPDDDLAERSVYLACSAAGLSIGRGSDARELLSLLGATPEGRVLDPLTVAFCLTETAMVAAARPLDEWRGLWSERRDLARGFLDELESRIGAPRLSRRAQAYCRLVVDAWIARFGRRVGLRSAISRARVVSAKVGRKLRRLGHEAEKVEVGARRILRVVPTALRAVSWIHRAVERRRLERHFDRRYAQPDPWDYTNAYERRKYAQTLQLIDEGTVARALEVGCAEGIFTAQLAPRVEELLAVDISRVALRRAERRCRDLSNVRFRQLDVFRGHLPEGFDLIVCSEVLYFALTRRRLESFAAKIVEALRPGGRLVMAHANVVSDEPDAAGFAWSGFGAKMILDVFRDVTGLKLKKEIRTPLYRVDLFTKVEASAPPEKRRAPIIVEAPLPELPRFVETQASWRGAGQAVPILMYHRIAPEGSDALAEWRVHPEAFERQLRDLKEKGFRSVPLETCRRWLEDDIPIPKNAIHITFDDGYRDFYEHAMPLLQAYGFSASVYLVAGRIGAFNEWDESMGERIPLLDWRQIRELQYEGVSFGSHSMTHRQLTRLPFRRAIEELTRSKRTLEQGLGAAVEAVAYPYGENSARVRFLTALAGYDIGLKAGDGVCTRRDSALSLPRVDIAGHDDLATFARKVGSGG